MLERILLLHISVNLNKNFFIRYHIFNISSIFSLDFSFLSAEIILLDGLICVYRSNVDLFFYVMGSSDENELILVAALNCLYDSISLILRKNVEKKALVENMDLAMLIMDEICDNG